MIGMVGIAVLVWGVFGGLMVGLWDEVVLTYLVVWENLSEVE